MFKNTKISTLVLLLSSTFLFLVNPLKAEAKPRRIAIIITSNGKAYCRYTSPEHYHKADGRPITQLADGIPLFAMENHKDCPKKW
ncbi:MAG: hypothetical protein AAFR83_07290 [Cyanobacteria bacterium J06629_18]